MSSPPVAAALFGAALLGPPAAAQVASSPPPEQRTDGRRYGPPVPADLSDVAGSGGTYEKRHVEVTGRFSPLASSRYFLLSEAGAQVLVLFVPELESAMNLAALAGARVHVHGIARVLPVQQGQCGPPDHPMPESQCADPGLPALPDWRADWPRVSITALGIGEVTVAGRSERGKATLAELSADPTLFVGKTIKVVGRFRGRNLFGDLPADSQRSPADWVIESEGRALWVTGKEPRGSGWALDPAHRADTVRWLEVVGRLEAGKGVLYLRASKVSLVPAPRGPVNSREDRPASSSG